MRTTLSVKRSTFILLSLTLLALIIACLQSFSVFSLLQTVSFPGVELGRSHQWGDAQVSIFSWLGYLRKISRNNTVQTVRLGCRELESGGQTCVYHGLVCIDTRSATSEIYKDDPRPLAYFVDETRMDHEQPSSDRWCSFRYQTSDPRYFSASRHWPIMNHTFLPQHSCLRAEYRKARSFFGKDDIKLRRGSSVKWVQSLSLVDLDYKAVDHNNHLLMDIIWLLDAALWQQSIDLHVVAENRHLSQTRSLTPGIVPGYLFSYSPRHILLPQSALNFSEQTKRDVNKLIYALVLRLDLSRLYTARNISLAAIRQPAKKPREAASLLTAYPELQKEEYLLFHDDIIRNNSVDYLCAPSFTAGAKIGNGAHERVCRDLRRRSYDLYGISAPDVVRRGQALFPQPPKRIVIYQRHVTRPIANVEDVEKAFREAFGGYGVEVERYSTGEVWTAEDQVRMFARAGVLFTSHGSQSMGVIWMPRYR